MPLRTKVPANSDTFRGAAATSTWQREAAPKERRVEPQETNPPSVATAAEAAALLAPLFSSDSAEKIAVLHLDRDRRLIAIAEYQGTADEAELPVRPILSEALQIGAEALIVAHNHPSGDTAPSEADRQGTRDLSDTARRLGITLYDHLIFGGGDCRSMRGLGLL
jgi:DNA repair protein RadC